MLTDENKKVLESVEKTPDDARIDRMLSLPPFEASDECISATGEEYSPVKKIDRRNVIIDGKLYIGREIPVLSAAMRPVFTNYYESVMKTMSWPEKIAYAANVKKFRKCSIKEYQKITDMECPKELENLFIREDISQVNGAIFYEYVFLFGCTNSAYYYYLIREERNRKVILEDDNLFIKEDVFRKLGMAEGDYQYEHKYD